MSTRQPARRCLDCQALTVRGSRCPTCQRRTRQRRNRDAPLARAVVQAATHCAICGLPARPDDPLTLDHIIPISSGGTSEPANLQAAHRTCNSRKRDRH